MIREYALDLDVFVYFRWSRLRKYVVEREFAIESWGGGFQVRVKRGMRTQGFRLRGPIEHFETL